MRVRRVESIHQMFLADLFFRIWHQRKAVRVCNCSSGYILLRLLYRIFRNTVWTIEQGIQKQREMQHTVLYPALVTKPFFPVVKVTFFSVMFELLYIS